MKNSASWTTWGRITWVVVIGMTVGASPMPFVGTERLGFGIGIGAAAALVAWVWTHPGARDAGNAGGGRSGR
ncbi:MAG: hypothetical protein M0R73_08005 [Dehalococcoidia bacterium]|nr:hypothetical protein [Dehalococcoidia bacterium]